jgi:hypothetical protein
MDLLKVFQEKYRAGKLTKERYAEKVKELLEDGDLTQEEHDKALEFDPKAKEGDDLIYSQEDMDRMAVNVARRLVRQEFKKAGIDLDVDNKGLLAHVVGMVKDGGKGDGKGGNVDEKELAQLRKAADKAKGLADKVKDLSLENAVLRNAGGQYTPVNPNQVVRALKEYADEIDYDDNDVPDKRSVDLVLRKLAKAEPNLFKTPEGGGSEDDDKSGGAGDEGKGGGNGFSGKTPGGGTGGNKGGNPSKDEATVADMLVRAGIKTEMK